MEKMTQLKAITQGTDRL